LRGSGLNRKDVWDEIKRPLGSLNELAIYFNIPLLVGGDFYIDPEALVTEVEVAKGKKSKTETQQAKEYKLLNLAHGIFMFAVEGENIGDLFAEVYREDQPGWVTGTRESGLDDADTERWALNRHKRIEGTPEVLKEWPEFYKDLKKKIGGLDQGERKLLATVTRLGLKLGIRTTWSRSYGGGNLKMTDRLRNVGGPIGSEPRKNAAAYTFDLKLKKLKYRVVGAVAPTNRKDEGVGEDRYQVADLFLANDLWKTAQGGVVARKPVPSTRFTTRSFTTCSSSWVSAITPRRRSSRRPFRTTRTLPVL
jgi:hypothetical protein